MPKQGRKKRNPNAPKRPMTAFFFFGRDERPNIKEESPDLPVTEVSKVIAARWRELPESKRRDYEQLAVADRKRYEKDITRFLDAGGQEYMDDGSRRRKKKKGGPKRGKSAYLFFCDAHRKDVQASNPELKNTEIMKKLAELWRDADSDERADFEELAKEDRARYEREKAEAAGEESD